MVSHPTISGNPYIGPRTFRREQGRLFFGREREARDLSARVMSERLLLFYAQSGAGKSSLINARLIPNLQKHAYAVLPVARVSGDLPPTVQAVDNIFLFNLMTSLLDKQVGDPNRFARLTFNAFLAGLSSEDGQVFTYEPAAADEAQPEQPAAPMPYVLILDQFEEIVTAHAGRWQERAEFFRQLNQALLDDPNLWVLLTLREDYVAALDPYKPLMFNRLHATFFMERMGEAAALEAARKPAELGGRPFAPDVAEKLVEDLLQVRVPGQETTIKGQYVEPVQLQVVCYQLWQTLTANAPLWQASDMGKKPVQITFDDLKVAGDVDRALEKFYDDTIQDTLRELQEASVTADVGERQLRSWFEDELITEAGTRGLMRQDDAKTGTLPNSVVKKLQLHFLVRPETRSGDTWFELIHDRFVDPIRASNLRWREQRRREQPWIDAAYGWHESGDSPEKRNAGLLLADLNLKTVLADTAGQQFEPIVVQYLEASKDAQEKRDQAAALGALKVQAEEERKRADLEAQAADAQRLRAAAESERADLEAKTAKVLRLQRRRLVGLVGFVILLAVAVAVLAYNLKQTLDKNQSMALAEQSLSTVDDPDKLLLARAAMNIDDTTHAAGALLQALTNGQPAPFVPSQSIEHLAGDYAPLQLAFNGDGTILALRTAEGAIQLWDDKPQELPGDPLPVSLNEPVTTMAFDPSRPRLVTASGGEFDPLGGRHRLSLWDIDGPTSPPRTDLADDLPSVGALAISRDGRTLVSGLATGEIVLWDLSGTPRKLKTLFGAHVDRIMDVELNRTAKLLASVDNSGKVVLWSDLQQDRPTLYALPGISVSVVEFSPSGTTLATGSRDGAITLWNLSANPPISETMKLSDDVAGITPITQLAFSSDGTRLVVGRGNGDLHVQDLSVPGASPWLLGHTGGSVVDLAFDPGTPERLISLSDQDASPVAWDFSTQSEFATIEPLSMPVTPTMLTSNLHGTWLAASHGNNKMYWIDMSSSREPVSFFISEGVVQALALSADGQQLAIAVCRKQLATGGPSASATPTATAKPTATTTGVPDAGSQEDSPTPTPKPTSEPNRLTDCRIEVRKYEPNPPYVTARVNGNESVTAMAFDPKESGTLLVGFESGRIEERSRDRESFGVPKLLEAKIRNIVDLAFNRDGNLFAAAAENGKLLVWDRQYDRQEYVGEPTEGERIGSATPEKVSISELAFLPGDLGLVLEISAGAQPYLFFWDMKDKRQIASLQQAANTSVSDITVDPTSQQLTLVQSNQIVRWSMDREKWTSLACERAGRNLSYEAWARANPAQDLSSVDTSDATSFCPGVPLHQSFALAMIEDAVGQINDCSEEQVKAGSELLAQIERLTVYPRLVGFKVDEQAIKILSGQALKSIADDSADSAQQAEECLGYALDLAGLSDVVPATARSVGESLVKAIDLSMDLLEKGNEGDAQAVLDAIDAVEQGSAQWPGHFEDILLEDLSVEDILLKDRSVEDFLLESRSVAINVLCEQGRTEHCTRIVYGQTREGKLLPGEEQSVYFEGKRGDLVTIAMDAVDDGLDTYLALDGPGGRFELASNDDARGSLNSFIEAFALPEDGMYRIRPQAYGGVGAYRLALRQVEPLPLALGETQQSTLAAGGLWTFFGQPGQIINASMVTSDTAALPALSLLSSRGEPLAYAVSDGGTGSARIPSYVLRGDEPYFVRVEGLDSQTPYQLRVGPIEPGELSVGASVPSSTDGDTLWNLNAAPGQIVQISLSAAAGSGLDTLIRLFDGAGQLVSSDDDGGAGYDSLLTLVLPESPSYLVQADRYGGSGEFELAVTELTPQALPLDGSPESLAPDRAWSLTGQVGQVLTVTIQDAGDSSVPNLTLVTAGGAALASSDGGQSLAVVLPQDGDYYLFARNIADSGDDSMTASLTDAVDATNLDEAASRTLMNLARGDSIDQALDLYAWGTTGGGADFSADALNALCWFGALRGAAERVAAICEELVDNVDTTDPYSLTKYHDSRGLARALSSKINGAIEDFQYYVDNGGDYANQRQEWVTRLRAGDPVSAIFDEATLEALLQQ